jgi:SAM-dependent methyltransferase
MRTFSPNQTNISRFMGNNILLGIKNTIKSFFKYICELPTFVKNQIQRLKSEFTTLHQKLKNISDSNIELGIYHLKNGNYRDAIFRFKLVEKYLDPNNKLACYWLGWAYLLKQDYKSSIVNLTKAEGEDKVNLLEFVKTIDTAGYVPMPIHELYRDIKASSLVSKFASDAYDIPKMLILELNAAISSIPEEYNILEIGSNVGLLAYEINKRMQEKFYLTATEISEQMIKLQKPDLYDKVLQVSVNEFLLKTKQKYDIVCSLDGFAFASDLSTIFHNVFFVLNQGGYFAFLVRSSQKNSFSNIMLEFSYNNKQLLNLLKETGFEVLSSKEFTLEIKNNYSIFVCKK